MHTERDDNSFPPEVKSRKRFERVQQGIPQGSMLEVDHIVPKYAGGTSDEKNAVALTRAEHARKHFIDCHDPPPKQNRQAEWVATRYIIGRMNLDEFTDFLELVEPMIPVLRSDLQEKREKQSRKR